MKTNERIKRDQKLGQAKQKRKPKLPLLKKHRLLYSQQYIKIVEKERDNSFMNALGDDFRSKI